MNSIQYFLGVDIGGTKIALCLASYEARETKILQSFRMKGASQKKFEDVQEELLNELKNLLNEEGIESSQVSAIGVCAPSPIDIKEGTLYASANIPLWDNIPIRKILNAAFETPVYLQNDANAAMLAEKYFGDAKGCSDALYLSMSTGIGGGIIANNQLVDGPLTNAGEFGHIVLDPSGELCGCGLRGCFETFCGGLKAEKRLRRFLSERGEETVSLWKTYLEDEAEVKMKTLLKALRLNDQDAWEFWDAYTEKLAQACGGLLMSFNPSKMIFGTIALHAKELFFEPLAEKLPKYAWQECIDECEFVTSSLGAEIGELSGVSIALYKIVNS